VRALRRILAAVLLLVLVAAGSGFLFLRSSLPVTDGTIALPGLAAAVEVTRDRWGIPTIRAANDRDAAFALGFVHAQDRLFQMDMMRRLGAGRLSEVFGAPTLALDRLMRTLGLYRAAAAQYPGLSPEVRAALEAYAAGVNAFLAARRGALPPEYYLLGTRPEPWQPADSLVWGKIMDWELTGNYRGEMARARLLQRLSPDDLAVLFPAYPKGAPVALGDLHALYRRLPLDRLDAALPSGAGPQRASNNWVVDGRHSQSGKPLLANDPHLDFSAPDIWYLARIETPQAKLAGATAPGTPFVVIGHSDRIAWGFTTTGGDVEDLYVEHPDPADPGRYMTENGPAPFVTRQETIRVKDAPPVVLTVRETRHGPVISDLAGGGGDLLALKTTWLGADDRTPQALWEMARARDWSEFRAALRNWTAPQQNVVYADVDGTIGLIAPARIPIRAAGDGWLPAPGWDGTHEWTGYVPFDALPSAHDPPAGRFVTANNKIVPDDYPYFITRDWELPNRAARIGALLDATPVQTPETSAKIQADDLSLGAKALLPLMLTIAPATDAARAAVERLRRWDGRMDRDKAEPLIFVAWLREFARAALAEKLGPLFPDFWTLRPDVMQGILTAHQDWCGKAGCAAALAASLDRALAGLAQRYGGDSNGWRWGEAHEAKFLSRLWSRVPLLRDWAALAIAADGGQDTVDAAEMDVRNATDPFRDRHGPTLRMIVDLAHPGDARFMIAPGQSGNPLSPHWGDLMRRWRDVGYLAFDDDRSGGTLTLKAK